MSQVPAIRSSGAFAVRLATSGYGQMMRSLALLSSLPEIAGILLVVARCEARPSLCQLDPMEPFSC